MPQALAAAPEHPEDANANRADAARLRQEATLLMERGMYQEALDARLRAVRIYLRVLPPTDADNGRAFSELSETLMANHDVVSAFDAGMTAFRVLQYGVPSDDDRPQTADAAEAACRIADAGQGDPLGPGGRSELFAYTCRVGLAKLPPDDLRIAESRFVHGKFYESAGAVYSAETEYDEAIRIYQSRLGPDNPRVAGVLAHLAWVYNQEDDIPRAFDNLKRALNTYWKVFATNNLDMA